MPLISRFATAAATLILLTCLAVGTAHAADQGPRANARGEYDSATATYVVAVGDDLTSISQRFGVPLQTLKTANKLESDLIRPGDQLLLAAGGAAEASTDAGADATADTSAQMNTTKVQSESAPETDAQINTTKVQSEPAPETDAQMDTTTVQSVSAPDSIETRIGTLKFSDGVPSADTARKVYDTLDFTRALNVYNNSFRGASARGLVKGFQEIGAGSGDIIIFEELMDADSLFLTGNADTVYYLGYVDLSDGPVVIEQPTDGLGAINDMWFQWVIDVGRPGPDRGLGGRYLIVGPDYDGPLPEDGYFVAHSKTNTILYALRAFIADGNDPKPAVDNVKQNLKIYPYVPGSFGTPIAEALKGGIKLAGEPKVPEMKFINASGLSFNTIPPSDYGFFEWINENVQNEPATSYDVELAGQLAAIGIVHGKPFAPDERMKKILTDAAAVGQGVGRALQWQALEKHPDWARYEGSQWTLMLWQGGALFETPPAPFEDGEFKPLPPTGARTLDSRTAFYYAYTLDSPAMIMQIPGVGSQYLIAFRDANGEVFDGAATYKVTLPKDIPAEAFWSLTLYDNQTRSMLQTPQKYPRAGSQDYPSPAAKAAEDGATTVWFSPEQPDGVDRGNWIQTDPEKGWFTILRLYSPLPSYFDKSWRPTEIAPVN